MKKKQHKSELYKPNESWLLPYADLLTLLFALFIVLFAMSELDAQKYKELAQVFHSKFADGRGMLEESNRAVDPDLEYPEALDEHVEENLEPQYLGGNFSLEDLEVLEESINQYIILNHLSDVIGTKLTDEGLLITILNDVSFETGSAKVKEEGIKVAEEIAELLYTDPPHQIVISGHADDRPIHNAEFASNWELSVARAVNFMQVILRNDKLDPSLFSAKGYGEHKPLVPNTSEENRAKNRRVEVLVLPNFKPVENHGS